MTFIVFFCHSETYVSLTYHLVLRPFKDRSKGCTTHRVIRRAFEDSANITSTIEDSRTASSLVYQLSHPRGIFVTSQFDLNVADCNNNRIQHFQNDRGHALTVTDNVTFGLTCPNAVILDANGNLFIMDTFNNRIQELFFTSNLCGKLY